MENIKALLVLWAFLVCSASYAQSPDMSDMSQTNNETKISGYLQKGFRAIVEAGISVGYGDVKECRPIMTSSFGYQFNPYIYLGGGIGAEHFSESDIVIIPIYGNFRSDFVRYKISPFVDVKAGYSPFGTKGGYASVALGCRFKTICLSTGTELFLNDNKTLNGTDIQKIWGYLVKLGIEF